MKLHKTKYIYFIIILAVLLYVPLALFRDFTPVNELKYINIVNHMISSKDWILLKFNETLYTDKPPLYFWIVAIIRMVSGGYSLFLIDLVVCIIPVIIIGIDIYKFLVNNNYNEKRAFHVILILYTTLYFIGSVLVIRMDILMTMFIVKALISFYNIIEKNKRNFYLPYIYIGLGFLVKGLASIFLPISIILFYVLITKQKEKLKNIKLGRGLVIILFFSLLWLIPLIMRLGIERTIEELLLKQTMNRAVNTSVHKRPIYYYLVNFIPNLFPWAFFFFTSFTLLLFFEKRKSKILTFTLCWFLSTFLIFSLISSKLDIYLIPSYMAIAIIVEWFLSSTYCKIKKILCLITSFIFFLFIIIVVILRRDLAELDTKLVYLAFIYSVFSMGSFAMGVYFTLKNKIDYFIYNIVINIIFLTTILTLTTPIVNEYIGYTKFAKIIRKEKEKNNELKIVGFKESKIIQMEYIIEDNKIENIENSDDLSKLIEKENIIVFLKNENLDRIPKNGLLIYQNKKFSIIEYTKEEENDLAKRLLYNR